MENPDGACAFLGGVKPPLAPHEKHAATQLKILDGLYFKGNNDFAMHHPASAACPGCRLPGPRMRWEGPLTEPDNIVRLAEGLQRLYGEEASLLIRQFAAENAKVGDAVSASFWNSIALVMTNSKSFMTHSAGEQG